MEVIMLDFNQIESDTKTGDFELIPDKTIAYAVMQLQGGDTEIPEFGRGNFFLKSQHSKAKWLPLEFTIIGGDYDGRKVWHRLFVDGDKLNEKNVPVAKDIGLKLMRAIIESARGIDSNDMSPEAQEKRKINGIDDLRGMQLCIKIGIEKGTNGYADKNRLIAPLTVGQNGYIGPNKPQQTTSAANNVSTSTAPSSEGTVPDWAK